jgi:hypothetical protein
MDPLWWFAGVLCCFHCSEFALAWTFSRHEVSWSCAWPRDPFHMSCLVPRAVSLTHVGDVGVRSVAVQHALLRGDGVRVRRAFAVARAVA